MRTLFLLTVLSLAAAPGSAQTTYTSTLGPATQVWEWGDPASWSPSGVPGPSDTAIIRSLVELGTDATVARLELRDGSLRGAGSLTVTESAEWTGGDLQANPVDNAAVLVPTGATFFVRDGLEKRFRGRDLLIDGLLDWDGNDEVGVIQTSDLHVRAGAEWHSRRGRIGHLAGSLFIRIDGTFRLTDGGHTIIDHDLGGFLVNGTLRIEDHTLSLGNATSAFTAGGTGTIDVQQGTLRVWRGTYDLSDTHLVGTDLGSVVASGDGRLILGTADFPGAAQAEGGELHFGQPPGQTEITTVILQSGTVGGFTAGMGVRVTESFLWWGGRIERVATIEVAPEATLFITSPMGISTEREFGGGTLVNHGRIVWDTEDDVATAFTHEIHNLGRIELQTDADLVRNQGFVRMVNDGVIIKNWPGEMRWDSEFGGFLNRGSVGIFAGTFAVERSPENGPNIGEPDTGLWTAYTDNEIVFLGRRRFGAGSVLAGFGRFDLTDLDIGSTYSVVLSPGIDDGDGGIGRVSELTFAGDLPPLSADGGVQIDLQGIAAFPNDVVVVEGTAVLGGTLEVRLVEGYAPNVGDRFRFLTAPGGVTGSFDAIDLPDGFAATVEIDATGADLVIVGSTPIEADAPPAALALAAAPNPARARLALAYALPASGDARLALVDALGREVRLLAEGPHAAGAHRADVDLRGLAPGVYVAHLVTAGGVAIQAVTVVR